MRHLKTSEAAALLHVSPTTLRGWERRFGYPHPERSPGRHRLYMHDEIAKLRDALAQGLSISTAMSRVRDGIGADADSLVHALSAFDREAADAVLEAALALHSLERSAEEVLLPALDEIAERDGLDSVQWAFAARWGGEWLRRALRFAPPANRSISILIGDATRDERDPDAPYERALELVCARTGAKLLSLPVCGVCGLDDVLATQPPDAVVLAGAHARDDEVARWAYAVRVVVGPLPITLYRRNLRSAPTRAGRARMLDGSPQKACGQLFDVLESKRTQLVSL